MPTAIAKKLRHIASRAGVKSREIARLFDTTPETVSRWKKGIEPRPDKLQRLIELEWLVDQLSEIYPQPDEARLFLLSRQRLLGGDSPANRIQKGEIGDVLRLIDQIKSGAYV